MPSGRSAPGTRSRATAGRSWSPTAGTTRSCRVEHAHRIARAARSSRERGRRRPAAGRAARRRERRPQLVVRGRGLPADRRRVPRPRARRAAQPRGRRRRRRGGRRPPAARTRDVARRRPGGGAGAGDGPADASGRPRRAVTAWDADPDEAGDPPVRAIARSRRTALDRILRAGRRAGSSKNIQRWDFIVVRDRARLAELAAVGPWAGPSRRGGRRDRPGDARPARRRPAAVDRCSTSARRPRT